MIKTIYNVDVYEYRSDGKVIDHYEEMFFKPLSIEEEQILLGKGWKFTRDDYMFLPDDYVSIPDYDEQMDYYEQDAHGVWGMRHVLFGITHRELMIKCRYNIRSFIREYRKLKKS